MQRGEAEATLHGDDTEDAGCGGARKGGGGEVRGRGEKEGEGRRGGGGEGGEER